MYIKLVMDECIFIGGVILINFHNPNERACSHTCIKFLVERKLKRSLPWTEESRSDG